MLRRTAILGLIAVAALAIAAQATAATRTVLAEMYGGTWCGYCPTAQAALTILESDYSRSEFIPIYCHIGGADPYRCPECEARAGYYAVGGVPHVRFDGVQQAVGVLSTAELTAEWYRGIIDARLATPTPIIIESQGIIGLDGNGTVTARIEAVDTVPYTNLRVQFVLYENGLVYNDKDYDWTVRDFLAPETVSLTGPPDYVEVTRNFSFDPGAWNPANMKLVVFVEDSVLKEVVNAQIMQDPYDVEFITSNYADEIEFMGEASFITVLRNAGSVTDTITTSIANIELPEGVSEWDWFAIYCDTDGICYFGDHDWVMAPGQEESLFVHVTDYNGTVPGVGVTQLTATSAHDRATSASEIFGTFCEVPSILMVDDDMGDTLEVYLENALKDTGYPGMVWDADLRGRPSPTLLESFWAVFWTTANHSATYITPYDEQSMTDYLDQGGNLFLASMDYLSSRVLTPVFVSEYLHIEDWSSNVGGFSVSGVAGDAISDGMTLGLTGGAFGNDRIDNINLDVGASEVFESMGNTKGLRAEDAVAGSKVVFLSFPFENIHVTGPAPNNQRAVVQRVVEYFMIETGIEEELEPPFETFALEQNFPNPFNPATTVRFSVPAGAENVALRILNVDGRVVRTLVDGDLGPGPYSRVWDGRDDRGETVASGVYFMRLEAGDEVSTRKMTLLK
jgi:thiol-disulfide isomerase/thioredoxin